MNQYANPDTGIAMHVSHELFMGSYYMQVLGAMVRCPYSKGELHLMHLSLWIGMLWGSSSQAIGSVLPHLNHGTGFSFNDAMVASTPLVLRSSVPLRPLVPPQDRTVHPSFHYE
jgi:hypothetical protein